MEQARLQVLFWINLLINIVSVVVGVLQILAGGLRNEGLAKLATCVAGPLGCGGLAWFIAGLVLRYRQIGNVCSGDLVLEGEDQTGPYAWKSGYFLNLYYLIVMWVLISVCACVCCVGIIAGVMAKANS